jgi:gephyrin
MKPGKPLTFAEITTQDTSKPSKAVLAFGLPGNPVSCMVCFNLFVVPAIRLFSGWSNPHLQRYPHSYICYYLFSHVKFQHISSLVSLC